MEIEQIPLTEVTDVVAPVDRALLQQRLCKDEEELHRLEGMVEEQRQREQWQALRVRWVRGSTRDR